MSPTKAKNKLSEETLWKIMAKFDQSAVIKSSAYPDGGLDPLWPRFERAALNQVEGGEATLPRYAIWANTVRDNIIEAIDLQEKGEDEKAKTMLVRAANSLSAFSEVQSFFDPNS